MIRVLRIGAVLGAILALPACVVADGPYYGGGYGYGAPRYSYAAPVYRPAPVRHWGHQGGWGGHRGWGGHGGWHRPVQHQQPAFHQRPVHGGGYGRPHHQQVNTCRVFAC